MKRIVISSCIFLFLLSFNQVIAQEKVKVTDDKTKVKYDSSKVKVKDDKVKVKDGDYKKKYKDDKTKVKDGENKIKIKDEGGIKTVDPYTATYSSNFVIGNPAHTKMIVEMWKDWDDNAFDRHDYWADTISVFLSDGSVTKGKAANLEGAKKFRGGLTSSKSTIAAMLPLRSTDRNEDLVAIWGTETNTWPDGKVETRRLHEIWRINKDGKIDLMRQYISAVPKQ